MSRLDDTAGHRQTFVAGDNSAQLLTVYLQHHNCRSAHPAHTHRHTHIQACVTAAPVTFLNNGGHCHLFVGANAIKKMVDGADGAAGSRQKTDKGPRRERTAFSTERVACTNREHGSSSISCTLGCVFVFSYWGGGAGGRGCGARVVVVGGSYHRLHACERAFVCAPIQTVEPSLSFPDNAIVGFSWAAVVAEHLLICARVRQGGGSNHGHSWR